MTITCRRVGLPRPPLKHAGWRRRVPAIVSFRVGPISASSQIVANNPRPSPTHYLYRTSVKAAAPFSHIPKRAFIHHGATSEAHTHLAVYRSGRGERRVHQGEAKTTTEIQGPTRVDIREIWKYARVNERRDRHGNQQSSGGQRTFAETEAPGRSEGDYVIGHPRLGCREGVEI